MNRIPITHLILGLTTMLVVLASLAAADLMSSLQMESAYDFSQPQAQDAELQAAAFRP